MNPNDVAAQWFDIQGQVIQDYEVPEYPVEAPEPLPGDMAAADDNDVETITADDVSAQANMMEYNKPISETIVFMMDMILPTVAALLLKGTDSQDLKLTPEEHAQLVNAWALYLGNKEVRVSPGMALLVSVATIYASKVAIAIAHRKDDEERKALEEELHRQQEEADRLKAELAAANKKESDKKNLN